MASNSLGDCCAAGIRHDGEVRGETRGIGDISTYFAYPESKDTSVAILLLTDIIGHESNNVQLIADQFAEKGYYVVMPDLFEGDAVALNPAPGFDLMRWLISSGPSKGHTKAQVDPIVERVIQDMTQNQGVKKMGAVGYCFGAKYVARFMGKGIEVGYMAHPSLVDASEIRALTGPISIAAAETDTIFPADRRRETEDILKTMSIPYQMTLFSGVEHGFAVRADTTKQPVKFAKEAAFLQAVTWFDEFLRGSRS